MPAATADELVFTDIASMMNVEMSDLLVESVAWGDYDNDNDPDLYLTADGANKLYRNDGGSAFTDVIATAGVGDTGWGAGTSFGDLDNDGDLDLYVVNFGSGNDVLYRNDGPTGPSGAYIFSDVTLSAGTTTQRSSRGMTFVDFDRDGLVDIYVNAIGDDLLYRNLGDLQFEDVAGTVGITGVGGQGVGVTATDVNNDGWVDLFTGNRSGQPNRLFLNMSGSFTDISANGIDQVALGMGVIALDYDNDLDMDLYWTTWPDEENALYVNAGGSNPTFTDAAAAAGTLDGSGWGISANGADVDNDGWLDFFVTNGFSDASSANVLFHNHRDETFEDATESLAGGGLFDGRGVGLADFDGDGDVDIMVTSSCIRSSNRRRRMWTSMTMVLSTSKTWMR
jgi:hypothetical protein